MSTNHHLTSMTVIFMLFAACSAGSASDARPDDDSGRSRTGTATATLEKLLDEHRVVLSTTVVGRAVKRFSFSASVLVPRGDRLLATEYLVARDADEVAVLVRSGDGLPYAYATNDLLVGVDSATPGGLFLCDGGAPKFIVGSDMVNFNIEMSYASTAQQPEVLLDLETLVRGSLLTAERVTHDTERGMFRIVTPKSESWIFLRRSDEKDRDPFPFRAFVTKSHAGPVVAVADIRTAGDRAVFLGIRKSIFEGLGLPLRLLTANKDFVPLMIPSNFGKHERERQAIDSFGRVFKNVPAPQRAPSTQPTTKPAADNKTLRSQLDRGTTRRTNISNLVTRVMLSGADAAEQMRPK